MIGNAPGSPRLEAGAFCFQIKEKCQFFGKSAGAECQYQYNFVQFCEPGVVQGYEKELFMDKVYIVAGTKHQYEIFLLMAGVNPKDFPYLARKSQLLGMQDFKYTLFGEFYFNEAYNDLMFQAKRGAEIPLSFYEGKF